MSAKRWLLVAIVFMTSVSRVGAQNAVSVDSPPAPEEQTQEGHPAPAHTGWSTLVKDTGRDFVAFPMRRSTWVLLAIGAGGALAAHPADDYVETHIVGNSVAKHTFAVGKWAGSNAATIGTSLGLWIVGRYAIKPAEDGSRTNKVSHLGFDLMRTQIVTQTLVHAVKWSVRRDRPTGECCAFPSGHAASAFAMASVLERHLGNRASWPALAAATYVATSRLIDNRHFLSDVVFGAALGEAAGWTIVGRHGRGEYALLPVPVPGGMMIALTRTGE